MVSLRRNAPRRDTRLQIERLENRYLLSADPIINEFLASNDGVIQDEDGDYSDFIELYNRGDATANLGGWYLTDNDSDLTKWQLPSVNLAPGAYLVIFASGKDRAVASSELHTNFAIAVEGEYLGLIQPDGVTVASEFSPSFPPQYEDVSYGVATDESETQLIELGTPASVRVPTSGSLGTTWTAPTFVVDASWQSGSLGVGFTNVPEPPVSTTLLQVDFNARGSVAGNTQTGFSSFVINGSGIQTGSATRSFGAIDVTLTDVSGLGYDDRLRAAPVNAGAFTESLLLRDFVFSRDNVGTSGLDVVIDGLTPEEVYTLTVWSFDSLSGGLRTSDWTANGLIAAENYGFDGNALPASNDTYKFGVVVAADSQGKITLQGRKDESTNNFAVFLNALRLETGDTLNPPAGVDDVLRVDFNSRTGGETGDANTEPDYSTMSLDDNGATFGDVQVTLSAIGGATFDDRDRTLPVDSGAFTLDQVYDDLIYTTGPAGSGMEILVSGLAPNAQYDLVLRSYDSLTTTPRSSIWTEESSGQAVILASPYTFNGSNVPTSNDGNTIRASIVSSPSGTLILRGVQTNSDRSVVVNALELTRASFGELIGIDLQATMLNQNSSAYIRVPFSVANLAAVDRLLLDMQYDSGFVAYLNGQEVARRNAPTAAGVPPAFNASATVERSASEALASETIDLAQFVHLLNAGNGNVLAIHGLNSAAGDGDFLVVPTLRAEQIHGETLRYFTTPTPGAANGTGFVDFVAAVEISQSHGFFDASFQLNLQTTTTDADIYYTFDGSPPDPGNAAALLYQSPILVDTTTVFRAAAFREGFAPSPIVTQTYVFLEDVLAQSIDPNNLANNPFGLAYPGVWQANAAGDFNMDPQIVAQWDDNNPANQDFGIREALLSLPTMSIVMDHDDLWNAATGIYPNATSLGDAWRRPGSIEYFDPSTGEHFQFNVGVQMHGEASRDNVRLKKHSFRLIFNPEFGGPGRLEFPLFDNSAFADINTVVLRASFTDSFATRTATGRYSPLDSTYTRDVWMRDSQLAMGSHSADSTYVHLYINGLYWGLYSPAERPDDAFLASRIGGSEEDWDIIRDFNELFRGEDTAWNEMFSLARQLPSSPNPDAIYYQLQGRNPNGTVNPSLPTYLDVENLIDYMILHLYAGAEDWPSHNWFAARNRVDPGTGFQFFVWDQEIVLDGRFRDRTEVNNSYTPAELYFLLRSSPEFRLHFADRVQKHLFNDGALTTEANQERWQQRADQIEKAIIGESARWGDARAGEVVNVPPTVTVPTMTVDHWRVSIDEVHEYFAQSHSLAISRFIADGLYTSLGAPLLSQFGGEVDPGFQLTLSLPPGSPAGTLVYYTLDGSDPRMIGGGVSSTAVLYGGPITLDSATQVKARSVNAGAWSALADATFLVSTDLPGDFDGNHVVDGDDYLLWRASFGATSGAGLQADGNRNGVVDAADYILWRNNLGATSTGFSFNAIGQTYTQNFNLFRGTEQTLPTHFSMTAAGGTDIYRGVFDSTTSAASSFTGIMAATTGGLDYSLAWRESTGGANLDDARALFTFTNNTGEAITGFEFSYDVEAWVNGRRDNQVRFRYDVYADSAAAQAAEGRNAFETDIVATINPNHTPIASNGDQFVLDGKALANRVAVSGLVDLKTLLLDAANPGLGVFGTLLPGQTAYFRWQISNANLNDGNRSALAIDNVSLTAVAAGAAQAAALGPAVASSAIIAEAPLLSSMIWDGAIGTLMNMQQSRVFVSAKPRMSRDNAHRATERGELLLAAINHQIQLAIASTGSRAGLAPVFELPDTGEESVLDGQFGSLIEASLEYRIQAVDLALAQLWGCRGGD